jgi:hypothetical protein
MRREARAGRMKAEEPNRLLPALADLYQASKAQVRRKEATARGAHEVIEMVRDFRGPNGAQPAIDIEQLHARLASRSKR